MKNWLLNVTIIIYIEIHSLSIPFCVLNIRPGTLCTWVDGIRSLKKIRKEMGPNNKKKKNEPKTIKWKRWEFVHVHHPRKYVYLKTRMTALGLKPFESTKECNADTFI